MVTKISSKYWIEVAIFAIVFAFFLYSGKKLLVSKAPVAPVMSRSPAEDPENNDSRNPASVSFSAAPAKSSVLVVDCLPKADKTIHSSYSALRFSAKFCEAKQKTIVDGTAFNTSNSAEITTYIDTAGKKLTTNYFALEPGANKILFNFKHANGKREERLVEIDRD